MTSLSNIDDEHLGARGSSIDDIVESRNWLFKMYEKYQHSIKCYLNNTFLVGMFTISRRESMNAYFDGYVHSNEYDSIDYTI